MLLYPLVKGDIMGKVKTIGKWQLNENMWATNNLNMTEKGKSLSVVKYNLVKNNNLPQYDYLILCTGCRVENFSHDMEVVKDKYDGVDKIINYFSNTDKNIIVRNILLDNDAPLNLEAKWLATYINNLAMGDNINSINMLGVSKGAVMAFNMSKHLHPFALQKTNLYTVAAPFNGTLLASPKYLFQKINDIVYNKIHNKVITKQVLNVLQIIFNSISSNSHMDYDIALPNGIEEDKKNLYDETFIKNMFTDENLLATMNLCQYYNICTGIDKNTLKEAIKTLNFTGIGLCLVDKLVFDEISDGLVPLTSQKEIENHLPEFKSISIPSSHHGVTSNNRVFKSILQIIDDTVSMQNEKKLSKKR